MKRGVVIPFRQDRYVALFLAVATALSRLPFAAHRLWEWDSVLYARALEQGFHVDDALAGSRPHPPGYLFYVASAAIARAVGLDSDHALIAVSIVASAVAVAACYLLCRQFAGSALALLLAVSFALDPLVWLHGEVAMPYILLATGSGILVLLFRSARGPAAAGLGWASLAFGVAAGFRQDLLLFLFPLWLWMLWPAGWRARLRAAMGLVAGCALWLIPTVALSDGPLAYAARTARQLVGLTGTSANAERSIALNLVLIGYSLGWALLLLTVVVVVLGIARALAARGRPLTGDGLFFVLWLLPPLLFYAFAHIGEWGFVLSVVPGLYALLGWLIAPIALRSGQPARAVGAALLAANAVLGATLFTAGSDPVFSAAALAAHDRATDAKTAYIREHVPPESSVILAAAELLVASYYLPERTLWYSNSGAIQVYDLVLTHPLTLVVYEPRAEPDVALLPAGAARRPADAGLALIEVPAGVVRLRGSNIQILAGRPR